MSIKEEILDILFPVFCLGCDKEKEVLCDSCLEKEIKEIKKEGLIIQDFRLQLKKSALYLSKVKALFKYNKNILLTNLIKDFKYSYIKEIKKIWKSLLKEFEWVSDCDFIIPIPLHKRRLRERGFNQTEVLADIFYQVLKEKKGNLKLNKNDLKRVKYTNQQAKLDFKKRQENIKNCFKWEGENLSGKKVLLIDDVFTTGSTLQEAAKVLKNNGVLSVEAFVLAKD